MTIIREEIKKEIVRFGLNEFNKLFELKEGWNELLVKLTPNREWKVSFFIDIEDNATKQVVTNMETDSEHILNVVTYTDEDFLNLVKNLNVDSMLNINKEELERAIGMTIDEDGNFIPVFTWTLPEGPIPERSSDDSVVKLFDIIVETNTKYNFIDYKEVVKLLLEDSTRLNYAILNNDKENIEKYLTRTFLDTVLCYYDYKEVSPSEIRDLFVVKKEKLRAKPLDLISAINYDISTIYSDGGLCDFEIASYLFDSYFEIAQNYNIDLVKEGLNLIFAMLLE